ncbi:hypothetical protein BH24ACT15_BH24ACT15_14420 [soil metagenome]
MELPIDPDQGGGVRIAVQLAARGTGFGSHPAFSLKVMFMPVPELSDDARRAALQKAAEARKIRAELKQQLRDGELTLAQVIRRADNDEIVSKTKVSAVLEAMPRIGKKTARRTMEQLNISESRRLRGLGDRQRARLLAAFENGGPAG